MQCCVVSGQYQNTGSAAKSQEPSCRKNTTPDSPQTVRRCDKNVRVKDRPSQAVFSEHRRDDLLGLHIYDAVGVQPQLRDDRQADEGKGHKGVDIL